ncbi:MAG: NAD(+) diphosphatase [Thermodesulfobacteriota bacterium]
MAFEPAFNSSKPRADNDLWFIIHEEKLAVRKDDVGYSLPRFSDVKQAQGALEGAEYFGLKEGSSCFLVDLPDPGILAGGFEFRGIFELLGLLEDELLLVAGCAAQLIRWGRSHKYCGQCGRPTEDKTDERAKTCPDCGLNCYPRLSPAVIVAVVKDDRLLLATSPRFRTRFWSVLAGFVEPGETLEECVVREVQEEVGILVRNVRYFDSQPWPFPDSLMLGFTAEYAEGEIKTDGAEIVDAEWFAADNLPNIPPKVSIARRLIDWFVENHSKAVS